ncbi:MAG TPA: HAD-IB family phosphatase, partial [Luteolibacter sp.]|nr:HAD-IB family phosphatase [Luteolibacter sp.]
MNGEIPLDQVFPKRMEIIRPDKATCAKVAAQYIKTVVPGAALLIRRLKKDGWLPVIISGGFAPLIEPLAKRLGIDHVEAVPLYLDAKGNYAGYGTDYPTTRNLGKNEIIREWKAAMLPERVGMMGDGISDLETKSDVDVFIGFGGVVKRPLVRKGSRNWIESLSDQESIIRMLGKPSKRHVSRTDKILSRQISKKTLSGDRPGLISAPMSTSSKKTSKGKRYSAEEKGDIVAFVEKHNAENGRGGQSAAAKKFGISQLTIASWLKSGGASTGAKRGRKPGSGSAAKGGSFTAKLGALSALAAQIRKIEPRPEENRILVFLSEG